MRWFSVMPLTFHLCQLCPQQCETLVSIMPLISIIHKKNTIFARFELGFDQISYGYSFSTPKDHFAHGNFEKNTLFCCISFWSFLGFIESDFLRIWGYLELNLWNWSKESSLWCPKIKTHMKSNQNQAQIVRKWCFFCGWLKLGA